MPMLSSVENFSCILNKCRQDKNMINLLHLHIFGYKSGLEFHTILGHQLSLIYSETESLPPVQQVFDKLLHCNGVSLNALIISYVKCSEWENALALYHKMQVSGSMQATPRAFVALLKACNQLGDLETGCLLLAEITRKGFFDGDVYIGSSLVDMFANCGSLTKAQESFDKLPIRNVVIWNALIAGYVEHGLGSEALCCYVQMQCEGISADATTLVCSLKACGNLGEIKEGQRLHDEVARLGFEAQYHVGNALVFMYAKCGSLQEAERVFEKLVFQSEVSHTSLIAGYVQQGHGEKALNCFEQMREKGMYKDVVTFVCSLKACADIRAIGKGRELHMEITCLGLERDLFVGSTLIDMYGRCGFLAESHGVFNQLSVRDAVVWTTLILGYVENGHCEDVLKLYEQMHAEGLPLGSVTFACTLKACGSLKALEKGQEIHSFLVKQGFLDRDGCVVSTMIDMYSKCGSLAEAHYCFDRMPSKTMAAWTSLIMGYVEQGQSKEAFVCFEHMQLEGFSPGAITFVCALRACAYIGALDNGQTVHMDIIKRGTLEENVYVGSTMVDMYAKCGALASAQNVFDRLPVKNVVSWTALVTGYMENGKGEDALLVFELMEHKGLSPVLVTFLCALKGCGTLRIASKGRELHSQITKQGQESESSLCHSLIDMYGKCGLLAEAQNVFDKLTIQDSVSWTALISGYVEHGADKEVLKCLDRLQSYSVLCLDLKIAVGILKACSSTGAREIGHKIHAESIRRGLDIEPLLGNILVDMYAKCGSMAEAQRVFNRLSFCNVISWTALIAGYADLGESEKVLRVFDKMLEEHVDPDLVTYVSVLNACSHSGLVERGQILFLSITYDCGLTPSEEHHLCLVDLFCRAGHINKAIALIEEMPYESTHVAWQIVLGACRKWGDVELGRQAFEQAVQLHALDAAAYVCMYNIYADADAIMQSIERVGVG